MNKQDLHRAQPREAAQIIADVSNALAHVHSHGVVHCDLKLANIILREDGRPVLVDFGIALSQRDTITQDCGHIFGTPAYMSPEQWRGELALPDGRSDIYSLGVILYELLTGRLPFQHEGIDELREQVLHAEPIDPRQFVSEVPAELAAVCLRALAKNPGDRYATAEHMSADLRSWLNARRLTILCPASTPGTTGPIPFQVEAPKPKQETREKPAKERSIRKMDSPPRVRSGATRRIRVAGILALSLMGIVVLTATLARLSTAPKLSPPSGGVDDRRLWRFAPQHGGGFFKMLDNGVWEEIGRNGENMGVWRELGRTAEYVELDDLNRKMTARLTAQGQKVLDRNSGKFGSSYSGTWEKENSQPRHPASQQSVYLSELNERQLINKVSFEKNCNRIVNGKKTPHGLLLHPPNNGVAEVVYAIGKQFDRFKTTVGVSDEANGGAGAATALIFSVIGDGKELWRSNGLKRPSQVDLCDVPVEGIAELRLRVHCPGDNHCAHAIWFEPCLVKK